MGIYFLVFVKGWMKGKISTIWKNQKSIFHSDLETKQTNQTTTKNNKTNKNKEREGLLLGRMVRCIAYLKVAVPN